MQDSLIRNQKMIQFRDNDILRYLHNEMENTEVAEFEASLDSLPEMQNRFEQLLDALAIVHNIDSMLDENSLADILSFANANIGIDNYHQTHQAHFLLHS